MLSLLLCYGCSQQPASPAITYCSSEWLQHVEEQLSSTDSQGHGPDLGSEEWRSVVEFKLGIRGQAGIPPRASEQWCQYIDQQLQQAATATPSFNCQAVAADSIAQLICQQPELATLDRRLNDTYHSALQKAQYPQITTLKAEQRGWLKGRDDCWKAADHSQCVRAAYTQRIAELQAWYRLVAARGPLLYQCDNNPRHELTVTYFDTQPPTLIAERADRAALMYLQPSASGARYQGRNETFWEHHQQATLTWGYNAKPLQCQLASDN